MAISSPLYQYPATVVRWVDGDTVWLTVDIGFRLEGTMDFRLYGINAPERGTSNGTAATARVNQLAPPGSGVTIQSHKDPDNFGRWLADVWAGPVGDGKSINQTLISEGLAVPYFGGSHD